MNIEIKGLVKTYGKRPILNIEKLVFERQKIYGITGINGVGKTTLLKIIAGLESYEEGMIYYNGVSLNKTLMKQISYVSQSPYMFKQSVFDNIAYPLKLRKTNRDTIEREVMTLLEHLKLSSLKNHQANVLSAGETQKVALARALVFKPNVLLLDEPTANIDSETMMLIETLLRNYVERDHMTVLHISHNAAQIERLCDHVIILEDEQHMQIQK